PKSPASGRAFFGHTLKPQANSFTCAPLTSRRRGTNPSEGSRGNSRVAPTTDSLAGAPIAPASPSPERGERSPSQEWQQKLPSSWFSPSGSRKRCTKAATRRPIVVGAAVPRNPMVGNGCARATSGHAAAALPRRVMKSRRLMSNMELFPRHGCRWVFQLRLQRHGFHEVTISHPLGVVSRPSARAGLHGPSSNPSVKAKNGFEPSFWSRGQNSFSKSESPPWVGSSDGRTAYRAKIHPCRDTAEHDCAIYDASGKRAWKA